MSFTSETRARFFIAEELRDTPVVVEAVSDQVLGRVLVNLDQPEASQLGEILVNARTFVTDSELRDRAIRGRILDTDQFEFISFVPSEIQGLPPELEPGQPLALTVTGELTIRQITRPTSFEVLLEVASPERLTGRAETTINRADFELSIPSVPLVSNVAEEVRLRLDFVAAP